MIWFVDWIETEKVSNYINEKSHKYKKHLDSKIFSL